MLITGFAFELLLWAMLGLCAALLLMLAARWHHVRCAAYLLAATTLAAIIKPYPTQAGKGELRRVYFYRTDNDITYLRDWASAVYDDRGELIFKIYTNQLPDTAHIQIWTSPVAETNYTIFADETVAQWATYHNPETDLWSRTIPYHEANSNNWVIFTTYIRPSQVLTNGVMHVLGVQCDAPADAVAGVPLHTGVTVDGQSIDLKTRLDARTMTNEEENE